MVCGSRPQLSSIMRAWRNSNVSGFQPEVPRAALGARTNKLRSSSGRIAGFHPAEDGS